jgi:NAD(P)-dependent dehydrogenase (short-subunit alcohol dehydrogenase family)
VGKLDGKVAVITGAGSGMGQASAVLFAEEGARVVCADRTGQEEEVAKGIGDAAIAVNVDVSVEADVQRMIATAEEHFGHLDVVYNNAGLVGWKGHSV